MLSSVLDSWLRAISRTPRHCQLDAGHASPASALRTSTPVRVWPQSGRRPCAPAQATERCGWSRRRLSRVCEHDIVTFERITTDPDVMAGVPCIRGLRIPVATVVAMVADGMSVEEIVTEHGVRFFVDNNLSGIPAASV